MARLLFWAVFSCSWLVKAHWIPVISKDILSVFDVLNKVLGRGRRVFVINGFSNDVPVNISYFYCFWKMFVAEELYFMNYFYYSRGFLFIIIYNLFIYLHFFL
jgi:hypothetical protein